MDLALKPLVYDIQNDQKKLFMQNKSVYIQKLTNKTPLKIILPDNYNSDLINDELPKNWIQKIDSRGRIYFVNIEEQRCQFLHPNFKNRKVNIFLLLIIFYIKENRDYILLLIEFF